MSHDSGTFTSPHDGLALATYTWGGDLESPRGVVQVAHGLAEHSARYARVAEALAAAGYVVAAGPARAWAGTLLQAVLPFAAAAPVAFSLVLQNTL